MSAKQLIKDNFISELAGAYLPIEDGAEAAELILLRFIMQARQIEREYIDDAPPLCNEEAVGLWPEVTPECENCDPDGCIDG